MRARRRQAVNETFLALIVGVEACARIADAGAGPYLRSWYNLLDFLAGIATFAALALARTERVVAGDGRVFGLGRESSGGDGGLDLSFVAGVLRCMRLLRLPRVLLHFRGLAAALAPLLLSSSALVPLVALHAVVLFIFGVLTVQLFGGMCTVGDGDGPGAPLRCALTAEPLPTGRHFQHLGFAIQTLFVMSMGDGWYDIMLRCALVPADRPRAPGEYMRAVIDGIRAAARAPPGSARAALALAGARAALPGCVAAEELEQLGALGLVDCNADGGVRCETTCGSGLALLLFPLFIATANFIVLNLAVAVTADHVMRAGEPMAGIINARLSRRKACRIYHVWRENARLCGEPPQEAANARAAIAAAAMAKTISGHFSQSDAAAAAAAGAGESGAHPAPAPISASCALQSPRLTASTPRS